MNPTVPVSIIDRAMEEDSAKAGAEYLAQFRTDIETFLDRELVAAAIDRGVVARLPHAGTRYVVAVDPSGGRSDSFVAVAAHAQGNQLVVDAIYERQAPFNDLDAVLDAVAQLARDYHVTTVHGDNYGAELTASQFRRRGLSYELISVKQVGDDVKLDRSRIYLNALALFTSGRVRLLDNPRLEAQLVALERRTGRTGHDTVDHPRGRHDDIANGVCAALVVAAGKPQAMHISPEALARSALPGGYRAPLSGTSRYSGVLARLRAGGYPVR